VFVPSIFLEQVQKIVCGDDETPSDHVSIPETGANTIIVNLADTRLGQAQRTVHTLYMPAYVLPIANILNGDASQNHNNAAAGQNNTSYNARFIAPDAHILAVDDVTTNLKVLRGLIAPYKMQIDCCTSGNEALKLVQEKVYDMVFLDHMMPGMDGIATLKAIRALNSDYYQKLPIVALTANAMQGMREQYLSYGFQDYLIKPIEIARLDAVLAHWLPPAKLIKGGSLRQAKGPEDELQGAAGELVAVDESSWLEKLQTIEGLDIQDALSHVGSLENYVEVLKQFHLEMKVYITDIQGAFDEKNWDDYTLRLHAVKGAFGTIGMKSISEWARELETAAKNNDITLCEEQTKPFCAAVTAFEDRLEDILPRQQETPPQDGAPNVDAVFVKEKLEALYLACYNFKSDDAEALINTLNQVSFQEQWYGSLTNIRTLVGTYEYGAAEKAIQALLTELRET
jgi:CheY-like chemotaxis protein